MTRQTLAALSLTGLVGASWLLGSLGAPSPTAPTAPQAGKPQATVSKTTVTDVAMAPAAEAPPAQMPDPDEVINTSVGTLDKAAIDHLRATLDGDDRAPPIAADVRSYRPAPAEAMANPAAYAHYQHDQKMAHYATYVFAAQQRLEEIDKQMSWGKENGVSDEQLKMAQEKRDHLARARERLLDDYPDLKADAKAPPSLQQK